MSKVQSTSTQKTIAKESGVSRSTVGGVLSGGPLALRYSEETRNKVLAAAERLHYRPSRAAQVMRNRRSNLIAVVHFGAGIEAAHKTNLAISREIAAAGYDYLAVDMNWHDGCVERVLSELIQFRVEGVLISHIQEVFAQEQIDILHRADIRVVSVNGDCRTGVPLFCDDVESAFTQLTEHLLEAGHQRILNLVGKGTNSSIFSFRPNYLRVQGFRKAIEKRGTWRSMAANEFFQKWPKIGKRSIHGVTLSPDEITVQELCKRLAESGKFPDAIVCQNDVFAIKVILAAQECGLRVAHDFAITGYDNDLLGAYGALGLTTAEQDLGNICKHGVEALITLVRNPQAKISGQAFPSRLVLRTSSGPRKADKFLL